MKKILCLIALIIAVSTTSFGYDSNGENSTGRRTTRSGHDTGAAGMSTHIDLELLNIEN